MIKLWSMKKDEESAKKKKPKTSPAQLRVQKGELGRAASQQVHRNFEPL